LPFSVSFAAALVACPVFFAAIWVSLAAVLAPFWVSLVAVFAASFTSVPVDFFSVLASCPTTNDTDITANTTITTHFIIFMGFLLTDSCSGDLSMLPDEGGIKSSRRRRQTYGCLGTREKPKGVPRLSLGWREFGIVTQRMRT